MFNRTVNSIVSSINKQIDALYKLATKLNTQADEKTDRACALLDEAEEHDAEARRAESVADKLSKLVA